MNPVSNTAKKSSLNQLDIAGLSPARWPGSGQRTVKSTVASPMFDATSVVKSQELSGGSSSMSITKQRIDEPLLKKTAERQVSELPRCESKFIDENSTNEAYFRNVKFEDHLLIYAPQSAVNKLSLNQVGSLKILDEKRMLQYVGADDDGNGLLLLTNIDSISSCKKNLFLPTVDTIDVSELSLHAKGCKAQVYINKDNNVVKFYDFQETDHENTLSESERICGMIAQRLQLMKFGDQYVRTYRMVISGNATVCIEQEKLNEIMYVNLDTSTREQYKQFLDYVNSMEGNVIHGAIMMEHLMRRDNGQFVLISGAHDGFSSIPSTDLNSAINLFMHLFFLNRESGETVVNLIKYIIWVRGQCSFISLDDQDRYLIVEALFRGFAECQLDPNCKEKKYSSTLFPDVFTQDLQDLNDGITDLCSSIDYPRIFALATLLDEVKQNFLQIPVQNAEAFISEAESFLRKNLLTCDNNMKCYAERCMDILQSSTDLQKDFSCFKLYVAILRCCEKKSLAQRIEEEFVRQNEKDGIEFFRSLLTPPHHDMMSHDMMSHEM